MNVFKFKINLTQKFVNEISLNKNKDGSWCKYTSWKLFVKGYVIELSRFQLYPKQEPTSTTGFVRELVKILNHLVNLLEFKQLNYQAV